MSFIYFYLKSRPLTNRRVEGLKIQYSINLFKLFYTTKRYGYDRLWETNRKYPIGIILLQVITHKYIASPVVCLLEEGLCKQMKVDQIIRQSTELISRIWRKHFIITTIQDFLQLKWDGWELSAFWSQYYGSRKKTKLLLLIRGT